MSEALSPHLTRLQYVRGYLNALQAEQDNINYNFEANQTYQSSGETLGTALDQSKTLVGLPARQLQPMVALKWKPYVRDSTTAALSLSQEELAFAYSAFDLLIPAFRDEYPKAKQIETMMFKGFIAGQLQKAKTIKPAEVGRSAAPQAGAEPTDFHSQQTLQGHALHADRAAEQLYYYGVPFDESTDVKGPAKVDLGGMENLPGYEEAMQGKFHIIENEHDVDKKYQSFLKVASKKGKKVINKIP